MSDSTNELRTCSRCKSTILLKYFEINRKGELYKLCNNCRNNKPIKEVKPYVKPEVIVKGCSETNSKTYDIFNIKCL